MQHTWCRNQGRADLRPGWLWCGHCMGHRELIRKHLTPTTPPPDPLTSADAEWLWDHPDGWARLQGVTRCAPSFVTPERAAAMLRDEPTLIQPFCRSNLDEPGIAANLLAYAISAPKPFAAHLSTSVQSHPVLRAAALIRSEDTAAAEQACMSPKSAMHAKADWALTDPQAETMLRDAATAMQAPIQAADPSLEVWLELLTLTRVPSRFGSRSPQRLRRRRAANLGCLLRTAQRVAAAELAGTGPLSPRETLWALLLFRLVRHAADSAADTAPMPGSDDPLIGAVNETAVAACDLFAMLTRHRRLPAGVLVPWANGYAGSRKAEWVWFGALAESSAAAAKRDGGAGLPHVSRTLTGLYAVLWRYADEFAQRDGNSSPLHSGFDGSVPSRTALSAARNIERRSGWMWQDDDIAAAASELFAVYYSPERGVSDTQTEQALRDLLRLPGASLATGQTFLKAGRFNWRRIVLQEDNKRSDEACLLADHDLRDMARSSSDSLLADLAASSRLPAGVAERVAVSRHDRVRMSALRNQKHLSDATLTRLAFDPVGQIAAEAAARLTERRRTSR